MDRVEVIDCEPTDNLVMNDHMDLGEEYFTVRWLGSWQNWFLGYDIKHNYNWLEDLNLKKIIDENKKMSLIKEKTKWSRKYYNWFSLNYVFNRIYQHYIFHKSKDNDISLVSMTVKFQRLPGFGENILPTQCVISVLI